MNALCMVALQCWIEGRHIRCQSKGGRPRGVDRPATLESADHEGLPARPAIKQSNCENCMRADACKKHSPFFACTFRRNRANVVSGCQTWPRDLPWPVQDRDEGAGGQERRSTNEQASTVT